MTRFLRPVLAAGAALLFVVPLVVMITGSLRDPGLPPPRGPELLPDPVTLSSYERAFELEGFEYLRYGYAAAATLVMFGITAVIVWVQWLLLRRWRGSFAI